MTRARAVASTVAAGLTPAGFLLRLGLSLWPVAHLAAIGWVLLSGWAGVSARIGTALALLYLLPPLLARVVHRSCAFTEPRIRIGSKPFFAWWALVNLQMIFSRCPVLEELLRLIPGLYSLWLRLWGSRIGRMTWWSPGVAVLDRSFLDLGDEVLLGMGVRLNPHVLAHDEAGRPLLLLARIRIGDRVLVGGYSLLTAGTEIAAGQELRAQLVSPPFSKWTEGRRVKTGPEEPSDA